MPPLGYDVKERQLVINPIEADVVKLIYEHYLKLGCVRQLSKELERRGIVSKVRISHKGIRSGGCRFSRGALYELLGNPIYIGEIRHKQERHPGQHEAILIERTLGASAATTEPQGSARPRNLKPVYLQSAGRESLRRRWSAIVCTRGDQERAALPLLRLEMPGERRRQ